MSDSLGHVYSFDPISRICESPRCFVFDVEIRESPEATGGWYATDRMEISVAVGQYLGCPAAFYSNWDRENLIREIMSADVVGGFNIWSFDLPLVFGVPRDRWMKEHSAIAPGLASKVLDPHRLARIACNRNLEGPCGSGMNLQAVAIRTLGHAANGGKSANGAEAIPLWKDNEITKLCEYCARDVWVESRLIEFIRRYRYFVCGQGFCDVKVDPLWA